MDGERLDEALELIWLLEEEKRPELERFRLNSDDPDVEGLLEVLVGEGLVGIEGDALRFTEKGRGRSRGMIRRHRLPERLFTDVFELRNDQVESDACKMEHILSEELTDR